MFGRDSGIARAEARRTILWDWRRRIDRQVIAFAERTYPWVARVALFVVYFWFGVVKLIGLSEATPLAKALTARTLGMSHFQVIFTALAVFECVIGLLCLVPRATRLVVVLLCVHLSMVCAPEVLVRNLTWQTTLVPTMDGQYIIKNVLIIAAAVGLLSRTAPHVASSPVALVDAQPATVVAAAVASRPEPHETTRRHRPRHIVHRTRSVSRSRI